ncbi:hypothetical protein AURDEDRAFT_164249 [Auricularia subglabra TFB-10046 SS5]|nr:hypothetical protein AURDEDRAFT_164249 [Auricularia subglabra TFB-10046 SS5]
MLIVAPVSYFPATDWQHNNETEHFNRTYHYTRLPGAYLTFAFNGSFVAYCSDSNFDHGEFFVSIDGHLVATRSSYSANRLPAMVLFSASVAPGRHVLRIDNTASRTVLGLDYFMYAYIIGERDEWLVEFP